MFVSPVSVAGCDRYLRGIEEYFKISYTENMQNDPVQRKMADLPGKDA
jgi:hypothetical protein